MIAIHIKCENRQIQEAEIAIDFPVSVEIENSLRKCNG